MGARHWPVHRKGDPCSREVPQARCYLTGEAATAYLLFDARPSGAGAATQYGVLFVAFRLKGGNWSLAVRLFESPGTRDYENCPTVSPDGKYLFFGRDDDIYWVSAEVIDARRPGGL